MIWRRVVALLVFSFSFLLPVGWAEKRRGVLIALGAWAINTGLVIWVGWRFGYKLQENFENIGLILLFPWFILLSISPASIGLQVKKSQSLFALPGVRLGSFIFYFLGFFGFLSGTYLTVGGLLGTQCGNVTFSYLSHPVAQITFLILLIAGVQCLHSSKLSLLSCLCGASFIGFLSIHEIDLLANDQSELILGLSFIAVPLILLLLEGRRTAHSFSLDGHRLSIDRFARLQDRFAGGEISSLQQPNQVEEIIANAYRSIIDRYEGKVLEDFRSRGLLGYLFVRKTLCHVMTMTLACLLIAVVEIVVGKGGRAAGLLAYNIFCVSVIIFSMYPSTPILRLSRKAYSVAFLINGLLQAVTSGVLVTILVCIFEPGGFKSEVRHGSSKKGLR